MKTPRSKRKERTRPWRSGIDWVWRKRRMAESESATERRKERMVRRPRMRRKEKLARASLRPVRRARVTSLCNLSLFREVISSAAAGELGDSLPSSPSSSPPHNLSFSFFFLSFSSPCIFSTLSLLSLSTVYIHPYKGRDVIGPDQLQVEPGPTIMDL